MMRDESILNSAAMEWGKQLQQMGIANKDQAAPCLLCCSCLLLHCLTTHPCCIILHLHHNVLHLCHFLQLVHLGYPELHPVQGLELPWGMLPAHRRRGRGRVISCGVVGRALIFLNFG